MFWLGECYEAYVLFIELFFMVTKSGNESLHENNWREGGQDVGRGALEADGRGVDQFMILQRLVIEDLHGLGIALKHTGDAHITRGIELLDAGDQAGGLDLDGHIAVFQHTLAGKHLDRKSVV